MAYEIILQTENILKLKGDNFYEMPFHYFCYGGGNLLSLRVRTD